MNFLNNLGINPAIGMFVLISLFVTIVLFVAIVLIINNSTFFVRVLFPKRLSIERLEQQIGAYAKKKKIVSDKSSVFSREQLIKANIHEPPEIFFARLVLIYIVLAIVIFVSLRPGFMLGLYVMVVYTIVFVLGVLTFIKYKQVSFEEQILNELPDASYVILSTLSREKNATILDALLELRKNYPKLHVTKAFAPVINSLQLFKSPEEALDEALAMHSFKFVELIAILKNYSKVNDFKMLSSAFNTYIQSIFLNIEVLNEANTNINHYAGIIALLIGGVVFGITNSVSRMKNLAINSGAVNSLPMMKLVSLYIPVGMLIVGTIVFIYSIILLKEKILNI